MFLLLIPNDQKSACFANICCSAKVTCSLTYLSFEIFVSGVNVMHSGEDTCL